MFNLDRLVPEHTLPVPLFADVLSNFCLDFFFFGIYLDSARCKSDSLMPQPTHHTEILEFQRLLPHRVSISVGKDFQVVLRRHQQLLRPLQRESALKAMVATRQQLASRACQSTDCVSKAVLPNWCVRDCETFSGSRRASQCQCSLWELRLPEYVLTLQDVVMTPVDQTQQSEDSNLRKIVAQLHVNLGHPSNDALARAIRLSGGSDESIQAALKVRCTVCERLAEPSPVPVASLRRWTRIWTMRGT